MLLLLILVYFVYIIRILSDAFEFFHLTRGFTNNPWSEVSRFLFFNSFVFFLLCPVSQASPVPVPASGTHHLFSSLPMRAKSYRECVLTALLIRAADIIIPYVNFHISARIRSEFQEMHPQSVGMVSGSMFIQLRDVWFILWEAILNLKRSTERSQVKLWWPEQGLSWVVRHAISHNMLRIASCHRSIVNQIASFKVSFDTLFGSVNERFCEMKIMSSMFFC